MVEQPAARRRPILKAALGGAAAIGAVGGAVRVWPGSDPVEGSRTPTLSLVGGESDGIGELEVPLDGPVLARRSGDGRWETAGLSSTPYSMLALTWDATDVAPELEVRTRADGRWSDWRPVPVLADGPDASSDEDASVAGTDLMWIGPSDGVQVRAGGVRPAGLSLVLLQPWAQPGDDDAEDLGEPVGRTAAGRGSQAGAVPRPRQRGRRKWGAQESWRRGHPHYNHTIKQVHVHHTASSNHYRRGDVPALIRGMYRYHTRYLGWSDIGYNFLVDRFGRIWTGRAGGSGRPVRGAHTLGFNSTSAGVAVIGNFETARPSDDVLDAVAAVAAWKLQPYDRDVMGNVRVYSHGSDRFRAGRKVRLPDHRRPPRHQPDRVSRPAPLPPPPGHPAAHRRADPPLLQGAHRLAARAPRHPRPRQHADRRPGLLQPRRRRPVLRVAARRPADPAGVGTRVRRAAGRRRYPAVGPHHRPEPRPEAPQPQAVVVRADDRPVRRVGRGPRLAVAAARRRPGHLTARRTPRPSGKVVVKVDGRRAVVRLSDGRGVATFGDERPLARGALPGEGEVPGRPHLRRLSREHQGSRPAVAGPWGSSPRV